MWALPPVDFNWLQSLASPTNFLMSDENAANTQQMNEIGVAEGDFVYVLGFPLAMVGEKRNFVIVKSGIISRIRDVLQNAGSS